jgi:alpha-L-fucosidase
MQIRSILRLLLVATAVVGAGRARAARAAEKPAAPEPVATVHPPGAARAGAWKNPLVKKGYLNSPLVETTPFVFGGRLYLAENYQAFVDSASKAPGADAEKDALRVRDVETGKVVSVALKEHSFGTVFVSGERVYAFSAKNAKGKPWRTATSVSMTSSADLKNWSEPRTVWEAEAGEQIFNVAVCRGPGRYVLLYETNDPKYPPFTFKYCESDDLVNWKRIPGGLYGTDKYVGGPALYYEGGWYYTLYLEALPDTEYETRITRSRDLKAWQDAPPGRAFLTFDRSKKNLPLRPPELPEKNASDPELCFFGGRTIVYFTGSDQQVAGDLQRAEFEGTPRALFEHFFEGVPDPDAPPRSQAK